MTLRFFNVNSVSLLKNGTCIKPRAQSGASYIPMSYRRSYIYGALNRMKGYGLEPAQMQLLAGRHLIMELKAEGWSGLKIYHPRGETAYTGWSGEGDTG